MMHGREKSDLAIVAMKPANKAVQTAAEWVEPRAGTKGNTGQPRTRRTQSRGSVSQGLERVRQAARQRKREKFTALMHHVTVDLLRDAFLALKRRAAPGVDGLTWQDYEAGLEGNLHGLHQRVQRGTHRALPVKRKFIPKPDGKQRPLGITTVDPPRPIADRLRYTPEIVGTVRDLARQLCDAQIVEELNRQGLRSSRGLPFTLSMVKWIRFRYGVAAVCNIRQGEITVRQLATRLGVSIHFVHYWIQQGLIQARQVDDNGPWRIKLTDEQERQLHHRVSTSGHLQNRG
jgi:hypothetical protein